MVWQPTCLLAAKDAALQLCDTAPRLRRQLWFAAAAPAELSMKLARRLRMCARMMGSVAGCGCTHIAHNEECCWMFVCWWALRLGAAEHNAACKRSRERCGFCDLNAHMAWLVHVNPQTLQPFDLTRDMTCVCLLRLPR